MTEVPPPTDAEFGILEVLWVRGPQTVRDVHEALGPEKSVRYTTVLKLLQNMLQKGLVDRDDSERSHVYTAAVERSWASKNLLDDLTERAFHGSTARLVLGALAHRPASPEELAEIRAYIDSLENGS